MNCQILFSRKNKKIISKCRLLQFMPCMLCIKVSKNTVLSCFQVVAVRRHNTVNVTGTRTHEISSKTGNATASTSVLP